MDQRDDQVCELITCVELRLIVNKTNTNDASEFCRYVYVTRPRCPQCQGILLKVYKSRSDPDGPLVRYTRCRECDHRFVVIVD